MTQSGNLDTGGFEALAARLEARFDEYLAGLKASQPFPVTCDCSREDRADGPALRLWALMQLNPSKGKRVEWKMDIRPQDGGWIIDSLVTQDGNYGDPFKPHALLNETSTAATMTELERQASETLEKLCEAFILV